MPLADTSIEEEVFNTILGGHDDVDEDEMPGARETGSTGYTSSVQEVTPKEAVQMEKCIVFTDTLMSLLKELHGSVCKRQGCGRVLEYQKKLPWHMSYCFLALWCWSSRREVGSAAILYDDQSRESYACVCFTLVWQLFH